MNYTKKNIEGVTFHTGSTKREYNVYRIVKGKQNYDLHCIDRTISFNYSLEVINSAIKRGDWKLIESQVDNYEII